ncbi:hypothetical protein DM860_003505 [Cuscuta australis]|uniref:Retrotransposon gag domain-containing protein n=1 Tax=Cuscuta australis TaxID=267555 RepID=A0A328DH33_9ASTE|nr:hypothetical protein DM860_003505 [Cuscuta australis]
MGVFHPRPVKGEGQIFDRSISKVLEGRLKSSAKRYIIGQNLTGTLHEKVYRSNYVIILFIPDFDEFTSRRLPGVVSEVGKCRQKRICEGLACSDPCVPPKVLPVNLRVFTFLTLPNQGDREEGQRKSAKQRLGQSVAHVSAFARLGEVREAEPARTRRSQSDRQEPARTRASHQEGEAESQPRLPVANRLTIPNDRVQQMEAKLERLEKKVGEKNDRDKPLAGSPFTTRVHLTPFPRKVKIDAPRFTGKEDPEIHLDSFNQSATMNGCTDEEKCLLFFQTLRNRATEWFNKLRPGSIDLFSDLASKFKAKFQENCTKRKKFTYLSTAGQRESENLTQFLTRWKEEVDKVEEMDDKTVLSLLLNGLRAGELYKEFCRKPPATYQEAYHTAWEFAEAETQLRAKREAEHGHKSKPVQVKKEEAPGPNRPRHHYDPVI